MKTKESIDLHIKQIATLANLEYSISWVEGTTTHKYEYVKYFGSVVTFSDGLNNLDFDLVHLLDIRAMYCGQTEMSALLQLEFLSY